MSLITEHANTIRLLKYEKEASGGSHNAISLIRCEGLIGNVWVCFLCPETTTKRHCGTLPQPYYLLENIDRHSQVVRVQL